jgi:hypothetical protein
MLGGHFDFVRYLVFLLQFVFFNDSNYQIYHWINSKLKRDRKNPQKEMKYIKRGLVQAQFQSL